MTIMALEINVTLLVQGTQKVDDHVISRKTTCHRKEFFQIICSFEFTMSLLPTFSRIDMTGNNIKLKDSSDNEICNGIVN